jgi:ribosomal protein S12 methylthiotransferase accessory factor
VPRTFRLSSSLRTERLEVTLSRARAVARQLGISRVTEITRLDCVGVPVFASIRPNAQPGSLCVNAGKGISPAEAKVGAYMEAVEYAFAEYRRSSLKVSLATARDIYEGRTRRDAILDFCPVMGVTIELDGPIACVEAVDIRTNEKFLVPAELVFLPFPEEAGGNSYFGSNSNGLCSGNSVLEATVHGLAEVIERDICSFQSIKDQSVLVNSESLPAPIRKIQSTLCSVGMKLYVRHQENIFQMPYFMAVVAESKSDDPIYVSVGYGCHPSRRIALTRAVCEALQSRLSFIHGGRDDLVDRYERFDGWPRQARTTYAQRLMTEVSRNGSLIQFRHIHDYSKVATDLESALEVLLAALSRNGFRHALRVIYTPEDFPLQVVRIQVPGLECFNEATRRIGLRLRNYVRDQV